MEAAIGDHFVIKGKNSGQSRRNGEVVEVLGSLFSPRQHLRVRRADGHETTHFPTATLQSCTSLGTSHVMHPATKVRLS